MDVVEYLKSAIILAEVYGGGMEGIWNNMPQGDWAVIIELDRLTKLKVEDGQGGQCHENTRFC